MGGWEALIPIGLAIVGLYTILVWAGNAVGWAAARLRARRADRVDALAKRMDGIENRMDSLEGGVTRVIELLEAQQQRKALPS